MMFDFNWNILEAYVPFFISGTKLTIELSVTASLAGFFLGLFLAVLRVSGRKFLSFPAACFMECIRGTPLLLQLLVVYFGIIPLLMRKPDGTLAAMLALSINAGAYIAETIRGGILAVDEGQEEAARALGLSHWQCLRYVVLPQAVRSVLPALGNSFVSLIKDSSLASVIAAPELMYWANAANAEYYRVWETFITTGLIYLILACFMECIRGTPLLLQLLVVYFGIIPLLMRKPDGTLAAMLALSINAGAYIAETIRGGILAVDEGQEEAARALGLSHWQCLRYVVLPQAVRSVLPALGNSFVSLIKDSSLASVIAAPELMYWANAANAEYYRVWETFITTGLIYLILTVTTGRLLARLERKRA